MVCNSCGDVTTIQQNEGKVKRKPAIKSIFTAISSGETDDLNITSSTINKVLDNSKYKDMSKEEQDNIKSVLSTLYEKTNLGIKYICSTCKYSFDIEPGSIIFSKGTPPKVSVKNTITKEDMLFDPLLSHTKNYVCQNEQCKTHSDNSLSDAIIRRVNDNSYNMIFLCTVCDTITVTDLL